MGYEGWEEKTIIHRIDVFKETKIRLALAYAYSRLVGTSSRIKTVLNALIDKELIPLELRT